MFLKHPEMCFVGCLQGKARGAKAQNFLTACRLQRVDGAGQVCLEDIRGVGPAGIVPEIMAGDLMAVGGDARDNTRAFLSDSSGGENVSRVPPRSRWQKSSIAP
jgi:hypothetical protein